MLDIGTVFWLSVATYLIGTPLLWVWLSKLLKPGKKISMPAYISIFCLISAIVLFLIVLFWMSLAKSSRGWGALILLYPPMASVVLAGVGVISGIYAVISWLVRGK